MKKMFNFDLKNPIRRIKENISKPGINESIKVYITHSFNS